MDYEPTVWTRRGVTSGWHADNGYRRKGSYICLLYGDKSPIVTETCPNGLLPRKNCGPRTIQQCTEALVLDNTRVKHRRPLAASGQLNPMYRITLNLRDHDFSSSHR